MNEAAALTGFDGARRWAPGLSPRIVDAMRGRRSAHAVVGFVALVLTLVGTVAGRARAEPTTTGFALNRYRPAEATSDWFVNESLDLRGSFRPALSLIADISYRPLVLYDANGDELLPLIDGQFYYHLGASLTFAQRLRLSVSVPLLVYTQGGEGRLAELGERRDVAISSSDGSGLGDVRVSADLRLLGRYEGPFTVAIGRRSRGRGSRALSVIASARPSRAPWPRATAGPRCVRATSRGRARTDRAHRRT